MMFSRARSTIATTLTVFAAASVLAAPAVASEGGATSPAASAAAPALSSADWRMLNRKARDQVKAHDYAGLYGTLQQLAPLLPGSPTVAYNAAASAARLGHADEAMRRLALLADAGLSYDIAADDDFTSLAARADWPALRDRFAANQRALGTSTRLLTFPAADDLPAALRRLPGVDEVSRHRAEIEVRGRRCSIAHVGAELVRRGSIPDDLRVEVPDLESALLSLLDAPEPAAEPDPTPLLIGAAR